MRQSFIIRPKQLIKFSLFSGLVLLIAFGAANFSGFCIWKNRFISDDEKLSLAKHYFAGIGRKQSCARVSDTPLLNAKKLVCTVPYDSIDDFINQNPGCCTLINGGDNSNEDGPPRFSDRLFGIFGYVVEAEFVEKENWRIIGSEKNNYKADLDEIHSKKVRRRIYFSNCGEPCQEVLSNALLLRLVATTIGTACYVD